jgi:hypothetical protein
LAREWSGQPLTLANRETGTQNVMTLPWVVGKLLGLPAEQALPRGECARAERVEAAAMAFMVDAETAAGQRFTGRAGW